MIVDMNASLSTNNEIGKMLHKLKDLVPGIPADRKMSKLEIMQHVIDYIGDLEAVLEKEPSTGQNGKKSGSSSSSNARNTLPTPYQLVN
ncbi:DNA-binding protein inhibitor ID-2 [Tyrophagus putrescentiae]|nr:DNA-binding protein inhibitor ID-2 [Tyrophagus putrescentiae]